VHDIKQILAALPHRYPFLLVDRVVEVVQGESIHAVKCVSINEPFFQGHFPGEPVMPGVLQLEALALAFSTTTVLLMTLGLMEISHGGRLDFPLRDLWGMLPAIYAICFAVAYQRYR